MILRTAAFADLDGATLYRLLRLRIDVFVVEQNCPYPELDGRDTEPDTHHLWFAEDGGEPLAYLRVLREGETTWRVGRVCTAAPERGRGLSGKLMSRALELSNGAFVLDSRATWLSSTWASGSPRAGRSSSKTASRTRRCVASRPPIDIRHCATPAERHNGRMTDMTR